MEIYTLQLNGKLVLLDAEKTTQPFDILPVFSTAELAMGYLETFGSKVAGEPKGEVEIVPVSIDYVKRRCAGGDVRFSLDHRGRSW